MLNANSRESRTARAPGNAASYLPHGNIDVLSWLLQIREKVVIWLTLMLIATTLIPDVPGDSSRALVVLCLTFLALNGLLILLLKKSRSARTVKVLRQMLMPFDMVVVTVACYLSGGVLTPLSILYPVFILVSIILLDPKGVYRTSALAIFLYGGMAFLEANDLIPYVSGDWGAIDYHAVATPTTYGLYMIAVSSMLIVTAFLGNRVATLIVQRNSLIESQLGDLHTLYDITKGLGDIMDEDEMLRYLANTLQTLQDASMCIIRLINKDNSVEIKASAGISPEMLDKLRGLRLDTTALSGVLREGKPIICEELDFDPSESVAPVAAGIKSAYVFPIKSEAQVLGCVSLTFNKVKSLSPEYNDLLLTITAQAGVALQRAQLFSDARRLAREMSALYDVGLYTGSTLSMPEVLRRTGDNIEKLMNPDAYYIALYDEESQMISFEVFKEHGQQMPRMRVPIEKGGLTARIVQSRKPFLVHDWAVDGAQYSNIVGKVGLDMLSYLGVPMLLENRVVGAISVQCANPTIFNEHDQRLLTAMSAQTAMALENAKLHQLAQEQAKLDSMTCVYNHGHFIELIRQSVAVSDLAAAPVSLIMLDIDRFKQYNDTYGHMVGDRVLKLVAQVLKSSVKESDAVGRWGGEEFGVLLPGTGIEEAQKVARRIRHTIAELTPKDMRGKLIVSPTISQGLSSYPDPAMRVADLIEEADAALYNAKARGRNQLVVYESQGVMSDVPSTSSLNTSALGLATIRLEDE